MKTLPRDAAQWLSASEFLRRYPLVSKNVFYAAIKKGELPHIKLGRKIFLPIDALDQLLEEAALPKGGTAIRDIRTA